MHGFPNPEIQVAADRQTPSFELHIVQNNEAALLGVPPAGELPLTPI